MLQAVVLDDMAQDIIEEKFPTPKRFSLMIEELQKELGTGYVDTIVHYCERNDVDITSVSRLINPTLKAKIQKEYEELNMLPKTSRLKKKK